MPNLIPAGVLADLKTIVGDSLQSTGTNSRTSASVACRISDDNRPERSHLLPNFMQLRRYRVVMPYGTDAKAGDTVTVSGIPYLLLQVTASVTYGVSCTGYGVTPNTTLFTDSVTFTNLKTNLTTPATNATIWRLNKETMPAPWSSYDWAIAFQPVTYSDASKPGDGHLLNWNGVRGDVHITRPYTTNDPTMPLLLSYFKDPD